MTSDRRRRERWRSRTAITLALTLALLSPLSASAYWSTTSAPLSAPLATASVPMPQSFSCAPSGGLLGIGSTANLSWSALPNGPAWRYQVWIRNESGSTNAPLSQAGQPGTSVNLSTGLLTGVLSGLISLLLGGQPAFARVIAIHPSGWASPATPEIRITRATILGGLTC